MKKLCALLLSLLVIFSLLSLTGCDPSGPEDWEEHHGAYADLPEDAVLVFSEDYQIITCNGEEYIAYNLKKFDYYCDYEVKNKIFIEKDGEKTRLDACVFSNEKVTILSAEITLENGTTINADYLHHAYIPTYHDTALASECTIEIWGLEEDIYIETTREKLRGKATIMDYEIDDYDYEEYYISSFLSDDTKFSVGRLIIYEGKYYFIDYSESPEEFLEYELGGASAYIITDNALIKEIDEAIEKTYDDEFGFLFDDNLSLVISTIFVLLVFAGIPLAVFIIFLILALRSKQRKYRTLSFTICGLAISVLIIFFIITAFVV